jgi:penicillin-binding protein 1A
MTSKKPLYPSAKKPGAPRASSPVAPRKKKSPNNNGPKKTTPQKSGSGKGGKLWIRRLFKWGIVIGLWMILALCGLLGWYARELPDITKSAAFERETAITILAADGSELMRYGEIKGKNLDVADLPPHMIYALLSIEDRRFYSHFGIDPLGMIRATVVNIFSGRLAQGGSTITQQLAKNLFLSHERTFKRKIQEAMLAVWLEYELSKDEILSAYLNRVYLGSGAYGIDAAAELYFGKSAKFLTLRESAMIAGLLQAPSRFSPRRNPNLANQRADVVLKAMADAGYITKDQAKGLSDVPPRPSQKPGSVNAVRYFTDWVVDGLDELIGTPDQDIIVQTTLNAAIQNKAENVLASALRSEGRDKGIGQGAVLAMGFDGAVLGMVGGIDYNQSQFNRVTQAKRQPGSSFKPFVYLTALENGWTPDTLVVDEPITEGRYRPSNYDGEYYGEVTLETALYLSLNTVAFRLIKSLGPDSVINTARRAGIISPLQPDLSLALGTNVVTPLELTSAYAPIANGGYAAFPYAITQVKEKNGKVLYQRDSVIPTRRVIAADKASQLQQMMSRVVQYGTGQAAAQGFFVAGKTGTSQESRDAWFVGFSDRIVMSVWVGNDDNSPMKKVTGGSTPARVWGQIMSYAQGQQAAPRTPVITGDDSFAGGSLDGLISRLLSSGDTPPQPETALIAPEDLPQPEIRQKIPASTENLMPPQPQTEPYNN